MQNFDVFQIPNVWEEVAGFWQPNWRVLTKYIRQEYPDTQIAEIVHAATLEWLSSLASTLGTQYRVDESKYFLAVSSKSVAAINYLIRESAIALKGIRSQLGELAWRAKYGKHVLLFFEDLDQYYRYISYYYPKQGEFIETPGLLVSKGFWHIVLAPQAQPLETIFHELVHLCLAHLILPVWLAEGLVADTEEALFGIRKDSGAGIIEDEQASPKKGFDAFWSGEGFSSLDQSEFCYTFARELVSELKLRKGFLAFVNHASRHDGGEESARLYLNVDLTEVANSILAGTQ